MADIVSLCDANCGSKKVTDISIYYEQLQCFMMRWMGDGRRESRHLGYTLQLQFPGRMRKLGGGLLNVL